MSGNPMTPSNVVPMPTNWPGPMFTPKTFPPGGPSCFSELAALNACYDSIQMMNQILSKVITDLVTNDAAVQKAIVEAIAASGSNVPLIGVTNGADAQPGQVGEYVSFNVGGPVPNTSGVWTTLPVVTAGILQPGDWDVWGGLYVNETVIAAAANLTPIPAGFSGDVGAYLSSASGIQGALALGTQRALISVPTLMAFTITVDTNAASTFGLTIQARRRR